MGQLQSRRGPIRTQHPEYWGDFNTDYNGLAGGVTDPPAPNSLFGDFQGPQLNTGLSGKVSSFRGSTVTDSDVLNLASKFLGPQLNISTPTNISLTPSPEKEPTAWLKMGGFALNNAGMIQGAGNLAGSINGLLGEKSEYNGPKGDLARGLDSSYDATSDMLMNSGNPYGMLAGGAMKVIGLGNTLGNKLGAGTDGMTGGDAFLGSNWGFLATGGLSLLNGALGSKSESMAKNEEAFAQVGSSYGGTGSVVDDALTKAGKKYGLVSGRARNKANLEIREAKRQQSIMTDIADDASDSFAILSSMSAINGNRRAFAMQGGYDQSSIRVGKFGIKLEKLEEARRKVEAYKAAKNKLNNNRTLEFKEGGSVNVIPTEILLVEETPEFKEGGTIETPVTYIELTTEMEEFKEGGSVNVIPDGALHARKHNMGLDGVTTKGIPVVSEKEDGEIELLAEIEKEEIIFRLEVTKKLEELAKDGSDEAAIEAGKLLVNEILYNTVDKTNNLL